VELVLTYPVQLCETPANPGFTDVEMTLGVVWTCAKTEPIIQQIRNTIFFTIYFDAIYLVLCYESNLPFFPIL